jgi:hypothetical protein
MLQRTKPVPEQLGKLIELVNLLPSEKDLRTHLAIEDGVSIKDALTAKENEFEQADFEQLFDKEVVRRLQKKLRHYIEREKKKSRWFPLRRAQITFASLWDLREALQTFCHIWDSGEKPALHSTEWFGNLPPSHQGIARVYINDEGKAQIDAGLLTALEGVEVARIRRCPICERFFWAGRADQKACSKKCNQTRRVRLWREKYQETYKQRRLKKAEKKGR